MPNQEFVNKVNENLEKLGYTISKLYHTIQQPVEKLVVTIMSPVKKFCRWILGEKIYTWIVNKVIAFKQYFSENKESICEVCKKTAAVMVTVGYVAFKLVVKLLKVPYDFFKGVVSDLSQRTPELDNPNFLVKLGNYVKAFFVTSCNGIKELWKAHPVATLLSIAGSIVFVYLFSFLTFMVKAYLCTFALVSLIPYVAPLVVV